MMRLAVDVTTLSTPPSHGNDSTYAGNVRVFPFGSVKRKFVIAPVRKLARNAC